MNTNPPQNRGLTAIDGAMALIVILLIVQIWLLSATLESYLAGHREAVLPGAIPRWLRERRSHVRCRTLALLLAQSI